MADSNYIDVASGLPRVANNEALYKRLLAKFENSVDVEAFDEALAMGDFVKAGEIVHVAKGVAGNLSLTAFYENSVILMDQLRNGGVPAQENVDAFRALYDETAAAINVYCAD